MPSVHSRLVGRKGPAILSTMNFIAPLLVFLLIAAVLTAGIVMAAAVKGSAILLLLGGLSDALDGLLARRAGGGSVWGARLDPLTDKILVSAPLLWLASQPSTGPHLPVWAVWLLLARELLISGWRAAQGSGGPASAAGKAKTILQFTSLLLLLWPSAWDLGLAMAANGNLAPGVLLPVIGWWLFWPSLLLALTSALGYLRPLRGS